MSDQTVGLPARKSRWSRTRALGGKRLLDWELRPASAWAVVGVISMLLARYFWLDEGSPANVLFTAAVSGTLVAFVVLLSRRGPVPTVPGRALVVPWVAAGATRCADTVHVA